MKKFVLLAFLINVFTLKAQILINEIYGGGGNTGALWNKDVVQLKNFGSNAETLTGWALQYASASGSSWNVDPIPTVTIGPGEILNVMLVSGANGAEPPMPNIQADPGTGGSINMSAAQGKLALTDNTNALTGSACPITAIDYVGYGSTGQTCGPHSTSNASGNTQGYIRTNTSVPGSYDVNTTPLPIKLGNFDAFHQDGHNILIWTTLKEINNDYFIIEYSNDGNSFTELDKVEGAGNSSIEIKYEFIHKNVGSGNHYYRLTQVDFDGKSEQFEVKRIKGISKNKIRVYPFQVEDVVMVEGWNDTATIKVIDIIGKQVGLFQNNNRIDMTSFPSGFYFIVVNEETFKIYKQ